MTGTASVSGQAVKSDLGRIPGSAGSLQRAPLQPHPDGVAQQGDDEGEGMRLAYFGLRNL